MCQPRQAVVCLDPFCDIFSDASEAVRRPGVVFHRKGTIMYPAHRPIGTYDTECLVVSVRAGLSSSGVDATPIFFVNSPDERSWMVFQLVGSDAENSLAGGANVNRLVLLLIENPEHLRNIVCELAQLLFAFLQRACRSRLALVHGARPVCVVHQRATRGDQRSLWRVDSSVVPGTRDQFRGTIKLGRSLGRTRRTGAERGMPSASAAFWKPR